jgi:hypothetical protein
VGGAFLLDEIPSFEMDRSFPRFKLLLPLFKVLKLTL